MKTVTDEQLRAACDRLGLNPLGTIEAELPDDMVFTEEQKENGECLENDRCYDFVTSYEWVSEPGPLGFAIGHPSPGWRWLRELVDHVLMAMQDQPFNEWLEEDVEEFFQEQVRLRARVLTWDEVLVACADISVNESHVDNTEYIMRHMQGRIKLSDLAYDLLDYVGMSVCRELFPDVVPKWKEPK